MCNELMECFALYVVFPIVIIKSINQCWSQKKYLAQISSCTNTCFLFCSDIFQRFALCKLQMWLNLWQFVPTAKGIYTSIPYARKLQCIPLECLKKKYWLKLPNVLWHSQYVCEYWIHLCLKRLSHWTGIIKKCARAPRTHTTYENF